MDTATGKDTVTEFHKAQGKHGRQLKALVGKTLAKWTDEDFAALRATRAVRDSAVAALTLEQRLRHVEGLSKEDVARRLAKPTHGESAEVAA